MMKRPMLDEKGACGRCNPSLLLFPSAAVHGDGIARGTETDCAKEDTDTMMEDSDVDDHYG